MSEAVDTRIVEAKFDSAQFEKGVDRTVKKLDELKKSLNLEESGKSITDLASKTESATDKVASALEKLENRFTSFTGMLKQKILSGIADEIVGALFKIKSGFENLVRNISFGQMQYGMQRYSDLLTSVRTMTTAGVDQNLAYEAIGKLSEYADQTSYSLDQLVSTMSKFRTAGADLMTAERMVMGLSNAAASMGVNAQQASRAYLNMQQAYSKGFMQQNDWISFESLPMVGEKFNQAIIDAAVKMKTLKKEADGTYKTIKEGDKQVVTGGAASKGITAQNMGTKLASKWFNKAVMEEVFGSMYYFSATDDDTIREIKKKESALKAKIGKIDAETGELYTNEMFEKEFEAVLKDIEQEKLTEKTEELNKALEEGRITQEQYTKALNDFTKSNVFSKFGWDAFRAGQEARSFADVINMLKDVISRGWSQSFEIIFGKLDEASDFFTKLADNEIINAIRSIIDFRNAILQHWRDYGGRDSMIEALENINEVIGSILGNFTIFYSDSDDFEDKTTKIGHALGAATDRFRDFTIQLKTWVTENQDKINNFVETMRKIKDTVALVIGAITTVLGIGFDFFKRLFVKLDPVFKSIEKAIEQVFGPIEELLDPKKDVNGKNTGSAYVALADALDNILVAADPLIKILPGVIEILAKIGTFLVEVGSNVIMANLQFIGETLGLIIDIFGGNSAQSQRGEGTFDKLSDNIEQLGEACKSAIQAVSEFFSALIRDLRKFFGVAGETDGKEGGAFAGLKEFFNTNEFIQSVKAKIKNLPNKIKSLFWKNGFSEEVYKQIARWDTKSAQQYKNAFKGPLTKILEALAKAIKDFVKQIPSKVTNVWNSIIDFIFGKKQEVTKTDKDGNLVTKTERVKEGFSKWLDDTIQVIKDWIKSIPQKIAGIWSNITGYFFNDEGGFDNSAFDQWLHKLIESVKDWFETNFKPIIKQLWTEIKAFIFGREAFEGWRENEDTGEMEYVTEKARKGIVNWLIELPGKIRTWFDENSEEMLSHVKKIWNTVIDFIFGKKVEPDEIDSNKIDENATIVNGRIKEGFSLWLFNLKEKAKTWAKEFKTNITEIWNVLIGAIFGNNEKTDEEKDQIDKKFGSVEESYKNNLGHFGSILKTPPMDKKSEQGGAIIESVKRFAENLGTEIAKIISGLPAAIAEKVDFGLSLAGTLFENINQWLEKINTDEYKESFEENIESFKKAIQEGDTSGLSPFAVKVIEIGQKIRSFITETIPGIISGAYHFISDESGNLLSAILALFDIKDWSEVEAKAQHVGEEVVKKIKQIPEYIRLGAESIKNIFTKKRNAGYSETEQAILDQFTDEQGRLAMTTEFRAAMEKSADQIAKEKEGWTIWDTIKDIGVAIGDAFVGLGPIILNGLNSAAEWINKGFANLTNFFKEKPDDEDLIDYIDRSIADTGDSDTVTLWDSIKKLGTTIYNIITKTIPNFLSEAFKDVGKEIPKLIGDMLGGNNADDENGSGLSMKSLFGLGNDSQNGAKEVIEDVANYTHEIVEGAEKEIKSAQEQVAELGGIELGTTYVFNDDDTITAIKEEREKTEKYVYNRKMLLNDLNKELMDLSATQDKNWYEKVYGWDIGTPEGQESRQEKIRSLQADIDALSKISAEVEHVEKDSDGKYSAFDLSDDKVYEFYKIIRRRKDILDELYDEATAGQNGLYTYPDYTKEQAGIVDALRAMTSEYVELGKDNTYSQVGETSKKQKTTYEGIGDIIGGAIDLFGKITDSDTLKIVAVSAAVIVALSSLRDMMSVADELEAPGYTAKWTAIMLAIIGIFGIVGYLIAISSDISDAGVKRLDQTYKTLDKVGAFVEKLGGILQTLTIISTVKTGLKTAGEVVDLFSSSGSGGGILGTLTKFGIATAGSEIIGGAIENIFDSITSVIETLGGAIDTFMDGLGPAIQKLSDSEPVLTTAIQAVEKIGDLLGKMFHVFDIKIYASLDEEGKLIGSNIKSASEGSVNALTSSTASGFEEVLQERMAMFMELSTILSNFAGSLKEFEGIKDPGAAMEKMADLVALEDEMGEYTDFYRFISNMLETVQKALEKYYWSGSMSELDYDLNTMSLTFQMLGSALSVFGSGIAGLTQENVKAFGDSLNVFNSLGDAFKDSGGSPSTLARIVVSDTSITKYGRELKNFSISIKGFFDNVKRIAGFDSEEETARTEKVVEQIIKVATDLGKVTTTLNTLTFDAMNFSAVSKFGNELPMLGSNIGLFISSINTHLLTGSIDLERLNTIAKAVSALGLLMEGFGKLMESYHNHGKQEGPLNEWISKYQQLFISGFTESLTGEHGDLYKKGNEGGVNFVKGFRDGMMEELSVDQIKYNGNIDESLRPLLESLMIGDNEERKYTITPVLNMTDQFISDVNTMRSMFSVDPITKTPDGWTIPDYTSKLATQIELPSGLDADISSIKDYMRATSESVSDFNNSLRSMRFIIDGQEFAAIVGDDIDQYLGRNGIYVVRNSGTS